MDGAVKQQGLQIDDLTRRLGDMTEGRAVAEKRIAVLEGQAKVDADETVVHLAQLADLVTSKAALERRVSELETRIKQKAEDLE